MSLPFNFSFSFREPFNFSFASQLIYVGPPQEGLQYGMTGQWLWEQHGACKFRPHGGSIDYVIPTKSLYSHRLAPTRHCPKE